LANKYDHDIKSFACRAKIEEEEANDDLEAKLAKLTSEHMALQADHKGLEHAHPPPRSHGRARACHG
jgi:hypothetical protein